MEKLEWDAMKNLEWNEEYIISAEKKTEYGIKKIKTAVTNGFISRFMAEREAERLRSKGYENVKVSIGKWTEKEI